MKQIKLFKIRLDEYNDTVKVDLNLLWTQSQLVTKVIHWEEIRHLNDTLCLNFVFNVVSSNLPELWSDCKQSGFRMILTCCFKNVSSRSLKSGNRKVNGLSSDSFVLDSNPLPSWTSGEAWGVPEWPLRLEIPATFLKTTSDNRTFRKWSILTSKSRIKVGQFEFHFESKSIKNKEDTPCCLGKDPLVSPSARYY